MSIIGSSWDEYGIGTDDAFEYLIRNGWVATKITEGSNGIELVLAVPYKHFKNIPYLCKITKYKGEVNKVNKDFLIK